MPRSAASPPIPLAWLRARLKRDKASLTGFVWLKRPVGDFKNDRDARAWNSAFAGKMAGTGGAKGVRSPVVRVRYGGREHSLNAGSLMQLFDTGTWPSKPPAWRGDTVRPWRDGVERALRAGRNHQGQGKLARFFAGQCGAGASDDLTVLSRKADPFVLDVPSNRRAAEWFAKHFDDLIGGDEAVHLRHLHYVFSGVNIRKPNGELYRNTWADWRWLLMQPAKAARWFGLVPWSRIVDNRNEEPVIRRAEREAGKWSGGFNDKTIVAPAYVDVSPTPALFGSRHGQPFCYAAFVEKSSPSSILRPIAERFGMNLYISSGELVDRLIWEMARGACADGRKLIVFTVADCDPAGHSMPISISRKLQAFAVSEFPRLKFEVVRAGLTPEQTRELELPSAPLKPSESRADRWRAAFGVGQTELDAAVALKRDEFATMIEAAIEPYFDLTLGARTNQTIRQWTDEAREAIADQVAEDEIAELQERYDAAVDEIEAVQERLEEIVETVILPDPPAPPEPDMEDKEERRRPLIDSEWGFVEGSLKLKADKAYENGDEDVGEDDE